MRRLCTLCLYWPWRLPSVLTVEGGFAMVLLGLLFYIFREKRLIQVLVLLLLSGLAYALDRGGM